MSSNLFGSGGGGGVGGLSHRPSINDSFGLRQRNNVHSKLSASDNNNKSNSNIEGENSHPNNHNTLNHNKKNNVQSFGKWGSSINNVRAPPRMSLASCGGGKKYGTPNRNNVASASSSNQQHQQKTNNVEKTNNRTATQSSAIVSIEETPNYNKSNTKIIEYKSKIRTEADIMLYPDEYDELYTTTNGIESTLDSLCEKILGWFFFWDTSQSY